MSRSYKKNPWVTDGYGGDRKRSKQIANRKFRRTSCDEFSGGRSQHKKYTNSWDICDYKLRMTEAEAIEHWYEMCDELYFRKTYPTLESFIEFWNKHYRRK